MNPKNILLCLYCFLFSSLTTFSQNISSFHGDISLDEIKEFKDWKPFQNRIYNGTNNGIYWFKIELPSSKGEQIISIPESHIHDAQLYSADKQLIDQLKDQRYITFVLPINHIAKTYYLKVNCLLEARIPIEIQNTKDYFQNEIYAYIRIGLYIGTVLSIMLINLFSFISIKNKTYLHYIFMVIGMAVNGLYKDGIVKIVMGDYINTFIEPTLNSIVTISSIFFTASYLNYDKLLNPIKKIGVATTITAIIINFIYLYTHNFTAFYSVSIFHLLTLDIFWFSGILLWKKSPFAKFFVIAYGLPLFLAHDYYISPHFGWYGLDFPLWFYKVGSGVEMIVFTYAIMYQTKKINSENKLIRTQLLDYIDKVELLKQVQFNDEVSKIDFQRKHQLTDRELDILKELSRNKTNKEISNSQFISENTVKYHLKSIYTKLDVHSRKEASTKFESYG